MLKMILPLMALFVTSTLLSQEPAARSEQAKSAEATNSTEEKPLSFWMAAKLEYSTAILQGLATEDFDLIKKNAEQMRLLNKVEGFVRRRNPQYRLQVENFTRVADGLIKQADNENIDGVALEFSQLTLSCVRCHQVLREIDAVK